MYLVAEITTRSAPSASGRCSAAVHTVLSTTSRQPWSWASAATAAISPTSVSGLAGVSRKSRRVVGRIAACHVAGGDAELGKVIIEQHRRAAEDAVGRDDVIAALQQAKAGGEDGRHARAGGHRPLAAFNGGDALLEHLHRWIGEARINVAGLLAGETRRRLGRAREHETGGRENGLAHLALAAAPLAGVHRQGVGVIIDSIGHPPLLL